MAEFCAFCGEELKRFGKDTLECAVAGNQEKGLFQTLPQRADVGGVGGPGDRAGAGKAVLALGPGGNALIEVAHHLIDPAFEEYGTGLKGAAEAIWQFNKGLIDALCDDRPAGPRPECPEARQSRD